MTDHTTEKAHTPYFVRTAGEAICEECSNSAGFGVRWDDAHPGSPQGSSLLDVIEREYEAFHRHHAAVGTRSTPEGFARLFREWIAPSIPPESEVAE